MKYTPENITSLKEDEVFVFGSNLAGIHGGGAAKVAYQKFGAVMGQGVGIQAVVCHTYYARRGGYDKAICG